MDEWELARMDYVEGLRLYESLEMQVGKENAKRMESNLNFMRIRIRTLPPREFFVALSIYEYSLRWDLQQDLLHDVIQVKKPRYLVLEPK